MGKIPFLSDYKFINTVIRFPWKITIFLQYQQLINLPELQCFTNLTSISEIIILFLLIWYYMYGIKFKTMRFLDSIKIELLTREIERNSSIQIFIIVRIIKNNNKMGNCKLCRNTQSDKNIQINADQQFTNPLQVDLIPSQMVSENNTENSFNPKSSRSCKQGLIIQRLFKQLTTENVEILDQELNQSQKLIAKNALKKHCIFSQLQEYELEIIEKKIILCSSKAGQYIFKEGNLAGSYYIILQGQCQLYINQVFKKSLKVGQAFGDLAIIYNCVRTGSIKSTKDCLLGMISLQIFSKIIEEINQSQLTSNLQLLKDAQVFKNFPQEYKRAIAAHCLTEIYDAGHVIINQGDRANSLYIIKEGTLVILQKNIEIGPRQCIGQACIIGDSIRSNTIFCKTKAQLLSISSQALNRVLGQTAKRTLILNLIHKIIRDSKAINFKTEQQIQNLVENCDVTQYKGGQIVIKKQQQTNDTIYVNIGSTLTGISQIIKSNVVIRLEQFLLNKTINFESDFVASKTGFLARIPLIQGQKLEKYRKVSQQRQKKQQKSTPQEKAMELNDLYYIKQLKQGNFGTAILAYYKKTHKYYIVKTINAKMVQKQNLAVYIENQQKILRDTPKHPFIVNFHKLIRDLNNYYFIMDYICGEDMFDFLNRVSTINRPDTLFYISQLVVAIEHLHSQKIVYRDLKPQNIMLNEDGYIVLIDFGSAKILSLEQRYKTKTIIGTPHYMAPQIIIGKGYTFNVDLWSLGIVAYEMMFGRLPYGDQQDDPFSIYQDIMNKKSIYFPKKATEDIKDLLLKLLHKKPQKRIGCEDIKSHKCMQSIQWQKILSKAMKAPQSFQCQKIQDIEQTIKNSLETYKQLPSKLRQIASNFKHEF